MLVRDEVLRLREFHSEDGRVETRLSWKGPTEITPEGYKSRKELEYGMRCPDGEGGPALLDALGFEEIQRIERYVEYYRMGNADVRLEWYPRMDVLVEVEGDPAGIEAALGAMGLPREAYSAEPLPIFAARFAERTGIPPALCLGALGEESPSWEAR